MIKPTSPCNYNKSTGSSMLEPFSVRWEKITRKLTKTGHDTAPIKTTLQQHNNPLLDPPCPSVLAQFLQRDEKRLTSINLKVSNPIHNQRIVLASKDYKKGSSAQPVDNHNKISKLTSYTQNNSPLLGARSSPCIQGFPSASSLSYCTGILQGHINIGFVGKSTHRSTIG
jgi:hypothetical protein